MKDLIQQFYSAFDRLDAEFMASCYHEDIVFSDPAFGELHGEQVKNMWRMLCEAQKGKEFKVTVSDIEIDGNKGSAHWEAFYSFSKTGRKVHNRIDAHFEFQEGKIIAHHDHFDLYKWSKQALGFKGHLLGHTGFFKKKLQKQTQSLLKSFESR